MKDWEKVLSFIDPKANKSGGKGLGRPRRMSIHTIAAICGRDPLTILEEMEKSGQVLGYNCPDVRTPIFYLSVFRGIMIDTATSSCWREAREWLVKFPFPETKGFKRFARDGKYNMPVPFEPDDKHYEEAIMKEMEGFREKAA